MTMVKLSAFASAQEAATYGRELETRGFQAQITGPVDDVLIDKPGSAISGWSEVGVQWYAVIASKKPYTPVP